MGVMQRDLLETKEELAWAYRKLEELENRNGSAGVKEFERADRFKEDPPFE